MGRRPERESEARRERTKFEHIVCVAFICQGPLSHNQINFLLGRICMCDCGGESRGEPEGESRAHELFMELLFDKRLPDENDLLNYILQEII
jgi:hypothetical protein